MKKVIVALLGFVLLTACGISLATPTISPEATTTPTATEVPPTPTITETPTLTETPTAAGPSAEFLATLNLNLDRTYEVVDNFYVDTYNNTKWVKLENGKWMATTLEERYGHLAPLNPPEPYQDQIAWVFGGHCHSGDQNYKKYVINAFWPGDNFIWDNQGINEEVGIFVIRDSNGELVPLNVRLHSPDVPGVFYLHLKVGETHKNVSKYGEAAELLPLGKQVQITLDYQAPRDALQPSFCNPNNGACTDQYNDEMHIFWAQEARIQAFIDALSSGYPISEDPDLILVTDPINIFEE